MVICFYMIFLLGNYQWYPCVIALYLWYPCVFSNFNDTPGISYWLQTWHFLSFFRYVAVKSFKHQPWLVSYLFALALTFPSSHILAYSVFIFIFLGWVRHCWNSYKVFSSSLLLYFPLVSSLIFFPFCLYMQVVWVLFLNVVINGAIVLIFRPKYCDH